MADGFDPYHEWLGISPKEQPPNHYRLLGIELFESKASVIENSADRQLASLRDRQMGKHVAHTQMLLNEITAAKLCLLDPARKVEYDIWLHQQIAAVEFVAPVDTKQIDAKQKERSHAAVWAVSAGIAGLLVFLLIVAALFSNGDQEVADASGVTEPDDKKGEVAAPVDTDVASPKVDAVPETAADDSKAPAQDGETDSPKPVAPKPAPTIESPLVTKTTEPATEPTPVADTPLKSNPSGVNGNGTSEIGKTVDLMQSVDAAQHGIQGLWEMNEGRLSATPSPAVDEKDRQLAILELPAALPVAYELKLDVHWSGGDGWFAVAVGLGEQRQALIAFDHVYRDDQYSGLELIDGASVVRRADARRGGVLKNAGPSTVTCSVNNGHIVATVEDEEIVNWQGSFSRLAVPRGIELPKTSQAYLVGSAASFDVSKIELVASAVFEEEPPQPIALEEIAAPIARWTFNQNLDDDFGLLHGSADGTAFIKDGRLVLDGNGSVITTVVPKELGVRSLEVWGTVGALEQMGVAMVSLTQPLGQSEGIGFDARRPGIWSAANSFRQTRDFGGAAEQSPADELIHLVLVYDADGSMTAWRNGQRYGWQYQSSSPVLTTLKKGTSQLMFGRLSSAATESFVGSIDQVRLYDRALTAGEIVTLAATRPLTSSEAIKPAKLAEPAADELAKTREQMVGMFESEMNTTRTPQQRHLIAQRMLMNTADQDDPLRFVFYELAVGAFAMAGDAASLVATANEMAARYDTDVYPLKLNGMTEASRRALVDQMPALARQSDVLIDLALERDDFDGAERLVKIFVASSRTAKIATLSRRSLERQREIREARSAFENVAAALDRLKVEPANPKTNALVGKHRCLIKRDWNGGLQHLAAGDDVPLAQLAQQEIALPTDAAEQFQLANGWWQAAAADETYAEAMRDRAAHWYRLAAPRLEGLERQEAESRLLQIRTEKENGWLVVFRGNSAIYWDTAIDTSNAFAIPLEKIQEEDIRYVRLRRTDTGEVVIVAIGKELFTEGGQVSPNIVWANNADRRSALRFLGLASAALQSGDDLPWIVRQSNRPFSGWGFGSIWGKPGEIATCWQGQRLDSLGIEIAIKGEKLDSSEIRSLLK